MKRLWMIVALCAGVLMSAGGHARAQSSALLPGSYRCLSYNVSGGGGSCANMPRLTLNPDGAYEYSSTRGRWSLHDGRLVLSASEFWGPGAIVGRDTVRFEYDYRGWHHVVTWVCQGCTTVPIASPPNDSGQRTARPSSLGGSAMVGVTLDLQFSEPIGGVSGFAIVPAAASRGYHHNDPIPAGAVTGLAYETDRTSVRLATNRNNKLAVGRQYVVFLSWPRETIPVAILDLPSAQDDYAATLDATLDGASVLARISTLPQPPAQRENAPVGGGISDADAVTAVETSVGASLSGRLETIEVRASDRTTYEISAWRVLAVRRGSPFERAGGRAGDLITSVGPIRQIGPADGFDAQLREQRAREGDVSIEIVRDSRFRALTLQ
jgi:hypothetical protein